MLKLGKYVYEGETVTPQININNIHTKKYGIRKFAGEKFSTGNVEESDQREDSFYLFEHEPFIKMKVKILAVEGEREHVTCRETAVVDGYASPTKQLSLHGTAGGRLLSETLPF